MRHRRNGPWNRSAPGGHSHGGHGPRRETALTRRGSQSAEPEHPEFNCDGCPASLTPRALRPRSHRTTEIMARQDANETFLQTSFLCGGNAAYLEELQAQYEKDPSSVDAEWRAFF